MLLVRLGIQAALKPIPLNAGIGTSLKTKPKHAKSRWLVTASQVNSLLTLAGGFLLPLHLLGSVRSLANLR